MDKQFPADFMSQVHIINQLSSREYPNGQEYPYGQWLFYYPTKFNLENALLLKFVDGRETPAMEEGAFSTK